MVNLYDILIHTAKTGCRIQDRESGRMPSGHNGPWKNTDTCVRTTSHWTILFSTAFQISGTEIFLECARRCVEFLLSDAARPQEYSYFHRKDGADRCNGLIGQAWTLEALVNADEYVDYESLVSTAEEVFVLHPFERELGFWRTVDIDGCVGPIHPTFNQQLWFAAIGAQLIDRKNDIETNVSTFLDSLETNLRTTSEGLIVHNSYPHEGYRRFRYNIKDILFRGLKRRREELAVGYHSFNLYGMALLYQEFPDHYFWETEKFESTLRFASSDSFLKKSKQNRFCFGYNPTGFELAYVGDVFGKADLDVQEWVERQLSLTFDPTRKVMNGGTDPATLSARFYEACRLPDVEIDESLLLIESSDE